MKLHYRHRRFIALAIGLIIVIFGLLQLLFKFTVNQKVADEVIMVLFILAFALLFSGRSKKAGGAGEKEQAGAQDGQAGSESPDAGETTAGDAAGGDGRAAKDAEQNTKGEEN